MTTYRTQSKYVYKTNGYDFNGKVIDLDKDVSQRKMINLKYEDMNSNILSQSDKSNDLESWKQFDKKLMIFKTQYKTFTSQFKIKKALKDKIMTLSKTHKQELKKLDKKIQQELTPMYLMKLSNKKMEEIYEKVKDEIDKKSITYQKRLDTAERMRQKDEYPALSMWWKDFFTSKSYEKYENGKSRAIWESVAKKRNLSLEAVAKHYKKNLLSVLIEEAIERWLKKDKTGKYKDGPDKDFTPRMKELVRKARKLHERNRNWHYLIFFKSQRDKQKTAYHHPDKHSDKKAPSPTLAHTNQTVKYKNKGQYWWADKMFYISPEKRVRNRNYVNDAIVANIAYSSPKKRYTTLFTYKYRAPLTLADKSFYPDPSYMVDVAIYYNKDIVYIGMKGTTKTRLSDWWENFKNSIGAYKKTATYRAHKLIIANVKKLLPNRTIRIVGHSRGGFWASELAQELNLAGSSFAGATHAQDLLKEQSNKAFNYYTSENFDAVSVLSKIKKATTIANIDGLTTHEMLNFVPRAYWNTADIKQHDNTIQEKYIEYLSSNAKLNPNEKNDVVLNAAKITLETIMQKKIIGSALAAIFAPAYVPYAGAAIVFSTSLNSEWAKKLKQKVPKKTTVKKDP